MRRAWLLGGKALDDALSVLALVLRLARRGVEQPKQFARHVYSPVRQRQYQ